MFYVRQERAPVFLFPDIFSVFHDDFLRVPNPPYANRNFQQEVPKPTNLKKQMSVKKNKADFNPQQGQYWCIEGDEAFEKGDYLLAVQHLNKAIELADGTESGFFKSRGEAYKKLKEYDLALKDAIQAIELDDKNIKAHLLCGQVMAEKGKTENSTHSIHTAIVRLTKALTLCAGQKKEYYENKLAKYIYRAKKLLWYKQEEMNDNQKRLAIQNYKQSLDQQNLDSNLKDHMLNQFIESIGNPDKKRKLEIPEYLICKITLDIMENPVITEAGICYEKDVLIQHFEKNGGIDPSTRKPISTKFNEDINMRQAIQYFLQSNPWAFEFSPDEDYKDIEF